MAARRGTRSFGINMAGRVAKRSSLTPGGHGGPPLQYVQKTMKLLLAFFLWTPFLLAQEVTRLENETPADFAKRNAPPRAELTHTVIETEAWGQQKSIIAFYLIKIKPKDGTPSSQVDGYLFLPKSTNTYQKILIYNFEEEGDTPHIEAVFFANADKDKAKELIVICSYLQRHFDVNGTLYRTFVFDDLLPGANPTQLTFLEDVSERVSGSCDCQWRDGKKKTSKYKTAASVKAGLRKLGF